jgi:hypothetical protein
VNRLVLTVGAICALLAAGCEDLRLPSEQEMTAVFTTHEPHRLQEPPPPESVPVLAPMELTDWHELCMQCHVGPHYTSNTILRWAHRDACVSELCCIDCHSERVHLTHVRGDKAMCIECHMNEQIPFQCETCHSETWRDQHSAHQPGFTGMHDVSAEWQDYDCSACHGSEKWCRDCHGLPMPHPADIEERHPELVRGQPDVCARCHGTHSCIHCHTRRGVEVE